MSRVRFNGGVIGQNVAISTNAASGMFDLASQTYYREINSWPLEPFTQTDTITLSQGATPVLINIYGERNASSNVSSAYRILEITFTPTADGTRTLYIGYKIPTGTGISTFYHDYTVAGVQLLLGSNVLGTFRNTAWSGFQTTTDNNTSALTTVPTSLSFSTIVTGATARRFNIDSSGTGSSRTGMLNGMSTSISPFPAGGGSVSQQGGTSYLYVETSGASSGGRFWMRKSFTGLSAGSTYTVKIAHYLNTTSQYTSDQIAFGNVVGLYLA
jgi:hypothetical protein